MPEIKQIVGASVILYSGNSVLLQKRRDLQVWGYHGGAVELGENTEDAARRELFEETGLKAGGLVLYGVFSGPQQHMVYPDGNEVYFVDIVYLCSEWTGELKPQEKEVEALEWFPMDRLPDPLDPSVKGALLRFCRSRVDR